MKNATRLLILLGLLLAPTFVRAQETPAAEEPNKTTGYIDFGVRGIFGDVYGRPDLPFEPSLKTSKMNEYRDIRDGFFIRGGHLQVDNLFGTKSYFSFQTQKAIYRDQSYLASVGQWGKYKLSFRFDQTPHIFSNTTRTIFTYNGNGVYTVPNVMRTQLQTLAAQTAGCPASPGPNRGCLLPSTLEALEPQMTRITPQLDRRAGMFAFEFEVNPDLSFFASYRREHMSGFRPLGVIINSSPSASLTGGYGAELPEPIDYNNHLINGGAEFGRERWGAQVSYLGSYFRNNITAMTFDNPFRTTDCITGVAGCIAATQGPATARYDLYPTNHANYMNFAGLINLAKNTNFMASVTPGWIRQDDPFLPYTSNTAIATPLPLPDASLHGEKQTLAMTYTLATSYFKNFEIKAQYRHYDYNNNTRILDVFPVQGDISAQGGPFESRAPSFNRKNVEVFGEWIFRKNNMVKVGYQGEWMDRTHRDVRHSMENGLIATVDLKPVKQVGFNASYRYSVRDPEEYEDEAALEVSGGITENQANSRRFDQAARTRNRLDMTLTFDPTDRLSFSAFAASTQDDFNKRGGVNSSTPLNFIAGSYIPYYAYGYLKDLSWFWGGDANLVVTDSVSVFAEYSHERYYHSMTGRYRVPGSGIADGVLVASNCGLANAPCDSANNDWASEARDLVDVATAGFDVNATKKAFFSGYYSLSAGKGISLTRPLGDVTLLTGVDAFKLLGTSAALDYPNTTSRLHELGVIFRYKINDRLSPKVEYRLQQWDNKDYQTSAMTPYMGCFSPIPNGPPVTNSVPGCTTPVLLTNTAFPLGSPSSFYPYVAVGDNSAARYLFLGADQPSYRSHYLAATLEFHF